MWTGRTLRVSGPAVPDLRVELAGAGLFLLRQGGQPVLMARRRYDWYGVHLRRAGRYRSPLPPPTADLARSLGGDPARWAEWFAASLSAAGTPLHAGEWLLRSPSLPSVHSGLVEDRVLGYVDWFRPGRRIVALREPSPPDAARVKAYRRQAREGVLPSLLLWWVSGLDAWVLLDGHDRLAAAIAEDTNPDALELCRAAEAPTLASPLPGGSTAWRRLARIHATGP
ncbi:hypothetical protein EV193_104150 [Herbihabitans rhizosphaerae]|uniref:Uncharacterized protein n=2 Tax=Herbihabitans rhizosphaerae TaxID=1872711 RepID=A0A4Q7KQ61_9PSEU|nr:hypothetical protein EV193_104150 [Herbihabitans rhizosphaerae]